jgi:hypothetical protein
MGFFYSDALIDKSAGLRLLSKPYETKLFPASVGAMKTG